MNRRLLLFSGLAAGAAAALWAYPRWLIGRSEDLDLTDVARPGQMLRLNGLAIHYVDKGQGPAVVLIHGLGGSLYNFRYNIPALSERFRVVALDLKGFGYSDRPLDADYSQTAQARLVADVMDRLGIGEAAVLGHSLGGAIALRLAALYPQRVARLILAASAPPLSARGGVPPLGDAALRPFLRLGTALVLHQPSLREAVLRSGFYDPSFLTPEMLEEFRRIGRIRGTAEAIVRVLLNSARDEPLDLTQIRQPTLLLWGTGDRAMGLRIARWFETRLPNARLRVIERARHMVIEERSDESNAAILAFLQVERA
jgi:pimeloyl-ACP methyl ester carboxylesterase